MARAVGIRVVHCTVEDRPDLAGFAENCRLLAVAAKRRRRDGHGPTDAGTVGALVVPELGADARDLVVPRLSGISAFTPSALDQVLRNLGVSTVVVVGVSVNLAIFGTAMSAVDLGYQVVLVRDAVVGIPADYADAVIDHSLSLIATVVSSDELEQVWSPVG
jgi:nicotinamidase-related amidase